MQLLTQSLKCSVLSRQSHGFRLSSYGLELVRHQRIIIVFIGSFVPIVLNTYLGIKEIDPLLVSAGKVLGANRRQILLEITLPATVSGNPGWYQNCFIKWMDVCSCS